MKEYNFDYPIKDSYGVNNYHWKENIFGTRSLEYVSGRFLWGFGRSGVAAGAFWFVFAWLVPYENYRRIGIAVGGCLFCLGGFVAGWLIERCVRARGPLLILKPDKTIVLHRLDKTVVPDSTTHFELMQPRDEWRQRESINTVDLVLWHQNRTYYVVTGGISSFAQKTKAPIEVLWAELCEIYPFEGMELRSQKKSHDQAIESQRAYNRQFVLFCSFILGSSFSLAGGWLLFRCFMAEKQPELAVILISSAFFGVGIINLIVFLSILLRFLGHGNNH